MVDVHRVSVLCNDVEADGNAFSSLVDETYPLGIFHHRSALLVSYTGKDKFPRADIRLILVEDNKAHRTRCGFTVRFEDIPDLVEMLLTMLRNVAPDVTYPTKQFVKNPIEFPTKPWNYIAERRRTRKAVARKGDAAKEGRKNPEVRRSRY